MFEEPVYCEYCFDLKKWIPKEPISNCPRCMVRRMRADQRIVVTQIIISIISGLLGGLASAAIFGAFG